MSRDLCWLMIEDCLRTQRINSIYVSVCVCVYVYVCVLVHDRRLPKNAKNKQHLCECLYVCVCVCVCVGL
jgi:hypothetical protein